MTVQEKAESDRVYWDTTKAAHTAAATVSTSVNKYGDAVTDSIDNSQLTNSDFLKLMLEELKQQDPTKPQDSAALMDSQLKMSTIQSNQDMSDAMKALQGSYANSALATASNMVGKVIQNGELNDKGTKKVYEVRTVENTDGELYLKVAERIGIADALQNTETEQLSQYDPSTGVIYEDGEPTDYRISLDTEGRFEYNDDATLKILDEDNEVITDEAIKDRYISGAYKYLFADVIDIPLSSVTAVGS